MSSNREQKWTREDYLIQTVKLIRLERYSFDHPYFAKVLRTQQENLKRFLRFPTERIECLEWTGSHSGSLAFYNKSSKTSKNHKMASLNNKTQKHSLGVVLQRVVIVIDADAKKQRTQALNEPLVLSQVLWDLSCQLQEASGQGFIQ